MSCWQCPNCGRNVCEDDVCPYCRHNPDDIITEDEKEEVE